MSKLKFKLMRAGYCDAHEHHAIRGGRKKKIAFDAVFALIKHPQEGFILFDTGYTKRFYEETSHYPEKIYANFTKVYINPEEEAVQQLQKLGIAPTEIKHLIISHFHADHVGGLKDFPAATFYCSAEAYNQVKQKNGFAAVRKGLLKGLIPADFDERVYLIDQCKKINNPYFEVAYDLFGDGLIQLIGLNGHGAGQFGALLKTNEKDIFLVADACWLSRSYQQLILPHPIVRLFFESWQQYKENLGRLHKFHKDHPEVLIIPTHCNATSSKIISTQIAW